MPALVDTELAAGTSGRRTRTLTPQEVARAVADASERPRFDVFVPRRLATLARILAVLPEGARVRFSRMLVPDQVRDTDHAARQDHEAKALGPGGS